MSDVEVSCVTRRRQRGVCTVCGNRVTIRDDGTLGPHYRGEGGRIRWNNENRCPGGFDPADDGTVLPVVSPVKGHTAPPPSGGELSVRTVSGGLPSSGRKR
ncbi:hypothetical protein M2432_003183 [Mycobacterium sp. OTB74]|nr:hypothetical protein [Mycobacterium sp. OTB74]